MNLRDALLEVRAQAGKLTPLTVLDAARDPKHPLHSRFEWDDSVAAEAYRREQAHQLIQVVNLNYRTGDGTTKTIRAFHAVRTETEYVYEPAEAVVADEFQRQLVLRDMERDWKTLKKRYQNFREFWTLVEGDAEARESA